VIVFFFYLTVILATFTAIAAVADLWLAHDERKRRDEARAEARAKRMIGAGRSDW
jgi:hypothetical protein